MTQPVTANIDLPLEGIRDFCARWGITEFALFGSVLRDDFGPDSDIDVLVTFPPGHGYSMHDYWDMHDELVALFGREVDLVDRSAVEKSHNWLRRKTIFDSARTVHAA